MAGRNTGRRSLLTKELAEDVLALIEAGNYVQTACAAVGISEAVYYQWLRIGRTLAAENPEMDTPQDWDDDGPRPEGITDHEWNCTKFLALANKSTARAEAYAVAIVRKHMPDQWTAAMTYLERRYPGRWKRREEHALSQGGQGADEREADLLHDAEAVALMHEALLKVGRGRALGPGEE